MKTSTRRQTAQKNHEGSRSALHALKRSFTTFSIALLMFSSAEAAPGQRSLSLKYNGDGEITLRLCEDGFSVAVYDEVALEFVIGVPSCPELNGYVVGSILAPYLQGQPSGTLMSLSSAWEPQCSAGATLHDTLHCMVLECMVLE